MNTHSSSSEANRPLSIISPKNTTAFGSNLFTALQLLRMFKSTTYCESLESNHPRSGYECPSSTCGSATRSTWVGLPELTPYNREFVSLYSFSNKKGERRT